MSKKLNISPQEQARWKEIGGRIRQAREAARPPISLAKLGKVIHRSKGLIGQIERGEVNPRIHIEEIASALNYPTAYFMPSSRLRKLPKRATPEHLLIVEGYIRVRDAFVKRQSLDGLPDIVRCWECQGKPGRCNCWVICPKCGRLHRRGQPCPNAEHYQINNF
jgi:transcriptional regulator with XRE-family HTH domain